MPSIRAHSAFKFLLAFLAILLLLSSVDALPTKGKRTAPKGNKHISAKVLPHKHGKATAGAAVGLKSSRNGAGTCPRHTSKSRLHKRAPPVPGPPIVHPSATKDMIMFHGTRDHTNAQSMAEKVLLSATSKFGDLHHDTDGGSEGGAYFTDSVVAAAQFACHGDWEHPITGTEPKVYVLEFKWTPKNHKICELTNPFTLEEDARTHCRGSDVMSGPMHQMVKDKLLKLQFWQYAIVKQTATDGLMYQRTHEVYCSHIGKGEALSHEDYIHGQGQNPEQFQELIHKITSTPC